MYNIIKSDISSLVHSIHLPVVEVTLTGQTHISVQNILFLEALAVENRVETIIQVGFL